MRVFITGASGFIGSALTKELISAGHSVLGLARSDASAEAITDLGADVHRGSLRDLESLKSGALAADAIVHLAFNHDFSKFAENCEEDKIAIETIGNAIKGSPRPFIVSSGIGRVDAERLILESDEADSIKLPRLSEKTGLEMKEKGANVSIMRLPQVHDREKQGLVTYLVALALEKKKVFYLGEGQNRYPAVHIDDCARLYRLALEKHRAGARYHAVADEGVTVKEIAETLGKRLNLPVQSVAPQDAAAQFGWLAMFAGMNCPASSAATQKELGWKPTGPDLLTDLRNLQIPELAK